MARWTVAEIPELAGKVALITGSNSGLGYETALALAGKHATVVMTGRNAEKLAAARSQVLAAHPSATVETMSLDLASLAAVREFATAFQAEHDKLDLLFNNAGVMAPPRQETADGFELQFGVNHLGHFALTCLLLPQLATVPNSRVINTTSGAQYFGKINFEDLQSQQNYSRYGAYSQSKLANVLFTFELQHRLDAAKLATISAAAHPGLAQTHLQLTTAAMNDSWLEELSYKIMMPLFGQPAAQGALPQLYAGVAADVQGGDHLAPDEFLGMRGYPTKAKAAPVAYDRAIAQRLWDVSETLTDIRFADYAAAPAGV